MSASSSQPNPRGDQPAMTDENILAVHEKVLGKQPDEKARYRLLPLNLLFIFSGLIFFGGTYLGRYAANFNPTVYNENAPIPTAKDGKAAAPTVDPLILGKATYAAVCATCHQPTGLGLPPAFPPLAGSEWVSGSEDRLIRIVLHGLTGPVKVKGTEFNGLMPGAGPGSGFNLSPEKVAAVITYVRKEYGDGASAVSTAKVNEVLSATGRARAPWTAAELEKLP
jgi:mono/diheme cytochrome c family protein